VPSLADALEEARETATAITNTADAARETHNRTAPLASTAGPFLGASGKGHRAGDPFAERRPQLSPFAASPGLSPFC